MEWITREECIKIYNIETSFFDELIEADLIEVIRVDDATCLSYHHLGNFERLVNFHYDLGINTAGLEVISRLLSKIESLQDEILRLK